MSPELAQKVLNRGGASRTGKIAVQERVAELYAGPLPPPEQLADYNKILPGAADRIFCMAEREQAHRHEMEKRFMSSQFRAVWIGQMLAALIGLGGVVSGTWLTLKDKPLNGFATFLTSVAVLAGIYFWNQRRQTKASSEAKPQLPAEKASRE